MGGVNKLSCQFLVFSGLVGQFVSGSVGQYVSVSKLRHTRENGYPQGGAVCRFVSWLVGVVLCPFPLDGGRLGWG